MTGLKRTLRSRRGFTLVELVVVLVIAGVTASFAVPALTGYIDNAKEKQAVSETQACVETATRIAAQKYALVQNASITGKSDGADALTAWAGTLDTKAPAVTGGDVALTEGSGQYLLHVKIAPTGSKTPDGLASQAGVNGTVQWMTCNASGQVLYLVYTSADGIQVVYTATGTSARVNSDITPVVVPPPEPDSSGGGGETGDGGTTGGGIGGGTIGGGETGSTATPDNKQFIIHMQDVSTGVSTPFAGITYRIKSGDNEFYRTSDANGDILLDISPYEPERHLPNTVIGDTPTTITEYNVPAGYQVIPSDTKIIINVRLDGDDYYLNSIKDDGDYNSGVVDMDKRRLTLKRFPVAKLNLRVTDSNGVPLRGAIFDITSDSNTFNTVTLECNENGECSIPVKLHDGDNIGKSPYLTVGNQTYVIKETPPPAGYQKDFTCKFNLYYKEYPSTPTPHHETWFYINSYDGEHGEWGRYLREQTVGSEDSFHVINTKP